MLAEYVKKALDDYVDGDPLRFDELWDQIPDLSAKIRHTIQTQNSWVYLTPQTYDGWYLLHSQNGYELYYQEKGGNCWGSWYFEDERIAIKHLLVSAIGLGV